MSRRCDPASDEILAPGNELGELEPAKVRMTGSYAHSGERYGMCECPTSLPRSLTWRRRGIFHRCALTVLLAWLLAQPGATAANWWVDVHNPACPGDGSSENPFCLIQDAIDASGDGDTIFIRPGTYEESLSVVRKSLSLQATGSREDTFLEFPPGRHVVDQCDDFRVVGLTFRGGAGYYRGLGLSVNRSSVSITRCRLTQFRTAGEIDAGAAIHASESTIKLLDSTFDRNEAYHGVNGGAFFFRSCLVTASNCLFLRNSAYWKDVFHPAGGAIYAADSTVELDSCQFVENDAVRGGAIYLSETDAYIVNCSFDRNEVRGYRHRGVAGGAIYADHGLVTIRNSLFCGNSAGAFAGWASGGAVEGASLIETSILCHNSVGHGTPIDAANAYGGGVAHVQMVVNSVFFANSAGAGTSEFGSTASARGAGAFESNAIACTFVSNTVTATASGEGGIATAEGAGFFGGSLRSSILWNNEPDQFAGAAVSYSNVMGGAPGIGNIDADPLFLGPDDFRLSCTSPCVDAGWVEDPASLPLLDASGLNYRVIGPSIDMGAYEAGLRWAPMIHHTGPHTRLSFQARATLFDPKTLATVFISLQPAPEGEGLLLPDGTGRRLGLAPDLAFQFWLTLPEKHRTTFLRGCGGASTRELKLPSGLPSGLRLFYSGFAQDELTGDIISVSDIDSIILD